MATLENGLDKTGLTYYDGKLKAFVEEKYVAKETGKGLSTNDYTTADKNKLDGLESYTLPPATDSALGGVIVGDGLTVDGDGKISANKQAVTWDDVTGKPDVSEQGHTHTTTDVTDFSTEVNKLIEAANHLRISIIADDPGELPGTGDTHTLYLLKKKTAGSEQNLYDEFLWTGEAYELIGDTAVNMDDYIKKTELVAITTDEIDALFTVAEPSS